MKQINWGLLGLAIIFCVECGANNNVSYMQSNVDLNTIEGSFFEQESITELNEKDIIETEDFTIADKKETKYLVVIDAGHQQKCNLEKEPVGPGANETKYKVSGGTSGISTKIPEYIITLEIAQKLEQELINRNYDVIMVRDKNDVNISNSERAQIANEANADVFIRIHCDGSDNRSLTGATTICQTNKNPYNTQYYEASKKLSSCVLDKLVEATGCKKRKVWETDTMSGINWCQVPVTIVEVGYMTNKTEDELLATDDYQNKIVLGLANGIDTFLNDKDESIYVELE